MGSRGPQPKLVYDEIVAKALELARQGKPYSPLSEEFECSRERIRQILVEQDAIEEYWRLRDAARKLAQ